MGFWSVDVVPSPKSHKYEVRVPSTSKLPEKKEIFKLDDVFVQYAFGGLLSEELKYTVFNQARASR